MATTAAIRQYQGLDLPEAGTYALDPSHTSVEFIARLPLAAPRAAEK